MSVQFDMSEVRAVAADMRAVDGRLNRWTLGVIEKGALNIKNQLRSEMQASRHFKGAAGDIDYDIRHSPGVIEAEIGPRSGPGNPGALANIAYFGTSRGGGTVRNPEYALAEEMPRFIRAMEAEAERLIFG